jgi:hypothetical protein
MRTTCLARFGSWARGLAGLAGLLRAAGQAAPAALANRAVRPA